MSFHLALSCSSQWSFLMNMNFYIFILSFAINFFLSCVFFYCGAIMFWQRRLHKYILCGSFAGYILPYNVVCSYNIWLFICLYIHTNEIFLHNLSIFLSISWFWQLLEQFFSAKYNCLLLIFQLFWIYNFVVLCG